MSNFIHKFSTAAEREAATYSEPWVSYTTETDKVEYSKINIDVKWTFNGPSEGFICEVNPINNVPLTSISNITYQFNDLSLSPVS